MPGSLKSRWGLLISRPHLQPVLANMGWLSIDRGARLILSIIVGGWVARYLGPADYGILNYGLAVVMLFNVLPGLGLDGFVRRELIRHPEDRNRLLGTAFFLKLVSGATSYVAMVGLAFAFEENPLARLVIWLNGLMLVQQSTLVMEVWFQSKLQSKYAVFAQNAAFALASLGRVALILGEAGPEAFAIMLALDLPVTAALLWYFYRQHMGTVGAWQWDGALARSLLRQSWPLALSGVAVLLYMRVDHVMLKVLAGAVETGHYAAAVRLAEIWHFVPVAMTASLAPLIVRAKSGSAPAYAQSVRRCLGSVTLLSWAVTIPILLSAPWVVRLLFGAEYAAAAAMLAILAGCIPMIATGVMRQEYLVNEGYSRFQLFATAAGAILNLGLNFCLIPRWGGLGAATATLLAHFTSDVLTSFCWAPVRHFGVWQLTAIFAPWRLIPGARPQEGSP